MLRILVASSIIFTCNIAYADHLPWHKGKHIPAESGEHLEIESRRAPGEDRAKKQKDKRSIFDVLFGDWGDGEADEQDKEELDKAFEKAGILTEEQLPKGDFFNTANMKIIDKSIGKLHKEEVNVNHPTHYDNVIIRLLSCWQPKQKTLNPKSRALLEIYEVQEEDPRRIFYGWMLAHSPSVSFLEHEKLDITLGSCSNKRD